MKKSNSEERKARSHKRYNKMMTEIYDTQLLVACLIVDCIIVKYIDDWRMLIGSFAIVFAGARLTAHFASWVDSKVFGRDE